LNIAEESGVLSQIDTDVREKVETMILNDPEGVASRAPRPQAPGVVDDGRADSTIYLDSLADWDAHRSLGVRISARLSRHIPTRPVALKNEKPIMTFTFDDVPETALTEGARLLEQAKARGTFYISTALLGRRTAHWTVIDAEGVRELHHGGHEIGLHGHAHLPVGLYRDSEFAADIARNRETLRSIDPSMLAENFAYPYGLANFARKLRLSKLVRSSRGVESGVNSGTIDAQFIRGVALGEASIGYAEIDRYLDQAIDNNGWLVFFTHDVGDAPSPYGVSKRMLHYAVEAAIRRGIDILTLDAALDRAKAR
jgi:peptidoglycan/xylan/chitin deacetylase (PgdA/CDA1 family)